MKSRWIALAWALCCGACTSQNSTNTQVNDTALSKAQSDIAALQTQVAKLAQQESKLRDKQLGLELATNRWATATFDPVTDEGFVRVDTSVASVIVSISDIQPYASGTRVKLSVGNLSSATLSKVAGKARYGGSMPSLDWSNDERAGEKYQRWIDQQKESGFEVSGDILPGTWNPVSLTLPGIAPSALGRIELSVDAHSVSLRRK